MRGVGGTGAGVKRRVWEVTVAARRSRLEGRRGKCPQVCAETGRLSSAKLLGSLGKPKETDLGRAAKSLVECGNWPGQAVLAGPSVAARGRGGLTHLNGLLVSPVNGCFWPRARGFAQLDLRLPVNFHVSHFLATKPTPFLSQQQKAN